MRNNLRFYGCLDTNYQYLVIELFMYINSWVKLSLQWIHLYLFTWTLCISAIRKIVLCLKFCSSITSGCQTIAQYFRLFNMLEKAKTTILYSVVVKWAKLGNKTAQRPVFRGYCFFYWRKWGQKKKAHIFGNLYKLLLSL